MTVDGSTTAYQSDAVIDPIGRLILQPPFFLLRSFHLSFHPLEGFYQSSS